MTSIEISRNCYDIIKNYITISEYRNILHSFFLANDETIRFFLGGGEGKPSTT